MLIVWSQECKYGDRSHNTITISQAPAPAPAPAIALAPAVAPAPAPALAVTGPRVWCRQPPDWAGNSREIWFMVQTV